MLLKLNFSSYAWMNFLIFTRNESNSIFFQHTQHMTWLITLNERERILLPWNGISCVGALQIFFRKIAFHIICLRNLLTFVVYVVLLKSGKLYLQFSK